MPTPLQQAPGGILGQSSSGGGVGHRHHPIHPKGLPQQLARRLPRPLNPHPRPLQQGVMAAGGPAPQGRRIGPRALQGQAVEGGAGPQPAATAGGELHQLVVVADVEGGQAWIERPLTPQHPVQVRVDKREGIAAVGQLQLLGIEAAVNEGLREAGRQQQGCRHQIKIEVGRIQAGMAARQHGAQQGRWIGLLAQQAEHGEGSRQIISLKRLPQTTKLGWGLHPGATLRRA